MRAPIVLVVLALAASALPATVPAEPEHPLTPRGVHVSFGPDPRTELRFVWYTPLDETLPVNPLSTVEMRVAGTTESWRTNGKVTGYPLWAVAVHEVRVPFLTPGAALEYRVGDPRSGAWSQWAPVSTPPDGEGWEVTLVAVADWGTDINPREDPDEQFGLYPLDPDAPPLRTHRKVAELAPDAVLVAGDISYADGYTPFNWQRFFDQGAAWMPTTPLMPSSGNHEYESADNLDARLPPVGHGWEPYLAWFSIPNEDTELYYSYNLGPVHVVHLHSHAYERAAVNVDPHAQRRWLESDLAAEESTRLDRWIVVVLHHPPFSSGSHGSHLALREDLAPLFDRYGVDLVISGHDHHYERSFPVLADGTVASRDPAEYVAPGAPVYVVTGGGGADLYEDMEPVQPEWSAYREVTFEVVRVRATEDALRVEAIATEDGRVIDSFVIR